MLSIMSFVMQFSTVVSLFLYCLSRIPPLHSSSDFFSGAATNHDYSGNIRGSAEQISISSHASWDTDCEDFADIVCAETRIPRYETYKTKISGCKRWQQQKLSRMGGQIRIDEEKKNIL